MAKYKIFVDGSSGTTGLRIADRLAARDEFEILHISEADRKDAVKVCQISNISIERVRTCLHRAAVPECELHQIPKRLDLLNKFYIVDLEDFPLCGRPRYHSPAFV